MNQHAKIEIRHSTCPHDCPSACALDIEVVEGRSIGRVRGSKKQTYTAGVVCAKVARYAERIHHPERLMHPMRRIGPTRSGIASPRRSVSSARNRSGRTTTPARWGW
jgi:anaerobic selenocysteine-containing dehydrogenase